MRFSALLPSALLFGATLAKANAVIEAPPTSLATTNLEKRTLCLLLPFLCNSIDYDTDDDNCGGYKNVCRSDWANGSGRQCISGKCAPKTCNNLWDWDWSLTACRSVASDNNNCGKCRQTCTTSNVANSASVQCTNGNCAAKTCVSGYTLNSGACTKNIDTQNDPDNCKSVGNKCQSSWSNGNGRACVAGICQPKSCYSNYDFSFSLNKCIKVDDDDDNCGRCNNKCDFSNGSGKCENGSCVLKTCNTSAGYVLVGGKCQYYNLVSDSNNCGAVGRKCEFPLGAGKCSNKSCVYTSCTGNYELINGVCSPVDINTDPDHCGSMTNVCPKTILNGFSPKCVGGKCTATCKDGLFDWDILGLFCRDVSADTQNCGKCGQTCTTSKVTGSTTVKCIGGRCLATACSSAYDLVEGVCVKINTDNDVDNCGKIGNGCKWLPTSPSGANGKCVSGQCQYTTCPSGYYVASNKLSCIKITGSQRYKKKDVVPTVEKKDVVPKPAAAAIDKRVLCPSGETACPIVGSLSFDMGMSEHYATAESFTSLMARSGGYECVDTTTQLDSCGGCVSTGEGQDCTKIDGAVGVGCDSGACVVFSCLPGWRPSLSGTKCVRATREHHNSSSHDSRSLHHRHLAHKGHGLAL